MSVPQVIFNEDGSVAEFPADMPAELRARMESPEFQAQARAAIRSQRATAAAESGPSRAAKFTPVKRHQTVRRSPQGVSRRDYRAMSRIARRAMKGLR